jgi:uncharacterized protein (TIGR02271 family)
MSSDNNKNEINWNEVIGKEALGENGLDFGTVKEVTDDYVVTEVGMLNKKVYHLPKSSAKYFNGVFLNFSINESDLSIYEQKIEESATEDKFFSDSQDKSIKGEDVIPLIGEELQVTKNIIEHNKKIVKVPVKETKTVQIELMHEKVIIERRNVSTSLKNNDPSKQHLGDRPEIYSRAEFLIPIKKEDPVVTKRSFVREEVVIKKKPVTETRTITGEITKEEISYNKGQNIQN